MTDEERTLFQAAHQLAAEMSHTLELIQASLKTHQLDLDALRQMLAQVGMSHTLELIQASVKTHQLDMDALLQMLAQVGRNQQLANLMSRPPEPEP